MVDRPVSAAIWLYHMSLLVLVSTWTLIYWKLHSTRYNSLFSAATSVLQSAVLWSSAVYLEFMYISGVEYCKAEQIRQPSSDNISIALCMHNRWSSIALSRVRVFILLTTFNFICLLTGASTMESLFVFGQVIGIIHMSALVVALSMSGLTRHEWRVVCGWARRSARETVFPRHFIEAIINYWRGRYELLPESAYHSKILGIRVPQDSEAESLQPKPTVPK